MTPSETVLLTRYVKACCPQQYIDEYTPDAWHDVLGDLDAADCKTAAAAVARRQPFVSPAEIRAEVKRVRSDRLAREIIPTPAPELVGDAARYRAELEAGIRRIADGRSLLKAIGPAPSEVPPPVAEVRATLGPALPPPLRLLPPQEIARRQVAESRAARGAAHDENSAAS